MSDMNTNTTSNVDAIVKQLRQERVVAYPTEAVYGLGCDPESQVAVELLLGLKQRTWRKGLILIAASYDQLGKYIDDEGLTVEQRENVFATWPGPITWVMPAKARVPYWLTGEFKSLAVRVSAHPIVKELCLRFGRPLVSTSANMSGMPPCRSSQEVKAQFGNGFPILAGSIGGRQNPSEIRDALTGQLFRQG